MLNISTNLVALLMFAEQAPIIITSGNTVRPKYHQTDYETICGSHLFRVRFRNGPDEDGRVDQLLIDGRPVRDAAEALQNRAARRGIDAIAIMNCGDDPGHPAFRGTMRLSKAASQVAGMRDTLFFRLSRQDRGRWQLTID